MFELNSNDDDDDGKFFYDYKDFFWCYLRMNIFNVGNSLFFVKISVLMIIFLYL